LIKLFSLYFIFFSSSITENNEENELIAIESEILEIDQEITRLRHKRSQLIERQEKLNNTIKRNQRVTLNANIVEQWQRTGWFKTQTNLQIPYSYHWLDFPWSSKVDQVRSEIFKINSFRQWQLETINVTLSGHDCILIMPTGGGKSLCYQLPAVISDGKNLLY